MRIQDLKTIQCLAGLSLGASLFTACGDDDSFSPIARDRGYDYAYTSAKDENPMQRHAQ